MPQPDPILDSLILLTNWPVQRTAGGYRLRFNYDDLIGKAISGISYEMGQHTPESYCPRLASDKYDHVPILFEMVQTDLNDPFLSSEVHYYTLGGVLHRDDKPAKYIMRPIQGLIVEAAYYQRGLIHRDHGPARYKWFGVVTGPLMDEHGNPDASGYHIDIESAEYEWFRSGQACVYPDPCRAEMTQLEFLFDHQHRYQDYGEKPALSISQSKWTWSTRGEPETSLVPISITVEGLTETYQAGQFMTRSGTFKESVWARGSESPKIMEDFPPAYMMDQINLWSGPFTKSSSVLLRLEDEYQRLTQP